MTHAESQELLLDLVYGELDEARAGEVRGHLAGCEECRKEKAEIDRTRRMTAPLRQSEQPSEGFDDRVLRAARVQAQLEHDGNIGQVVEVSGSVKALGIEAKDIDATAPVKIRGAERGRPRWFMPAAVGGSVAAAAALVLVVGTALQPRRVPQVEEQGRFEIRVQPVGEKPPAPAPSQGPSPAAQPAQPAPSDDGQRLAAPARAATKKSEAPAPASTRNRARPMAGSGGDAPPPPQASSKVSEDAAPVEAARPDRVLSGPRGTPGDKAASAPAAALSPPEASKEIAAGVSKATQAAPARGAKSAPSAVPTLPRAQATAMREAPLEKREPVGETAEGLEQRAREIRHAGDYAEAATLYRKAAQVHRERGMAAGFAAWDLAHAVECLAASGQFEEARKVRDELGAAYPGEESARSAAARVLRTVEPLAPAAKTPAQGQPDVAPVQR